MDKDRIAGSAKKIKGSINKKGEGWGRRGAPGFEFQSWLLRLGVRTRPAGSDVGYILSPGRADVKQLRELKL